MLGSSATESTTYGLDGVAEEQQKHLFWLYQRTFVGSMGNEAKGRVRNQIMRPCVLLRNVCMFGFGGTRV